MSSPERLQKASYLLTSVQLKASLSTMEQALQRASQAAKDTWDAWQQEVRALQQQRESHLAGLTWTTEKPTKPGWYWYRDETNEYLENKPCMVRVWSTNKEWWMDGCRIKPDQHGDFCGPLMPPCTPTKNDSYTAARGCAPSLSGMSAEEAIRRVRDGTSTEGGDNE